MTKQALQLPSTKDVAEAISAHVLANMHVFTNPANGKNSFTPNTEYAMPFSVGDVTGQLVVTWNSLKNIADVPNATTERIPRTPAERVAWLEAELAKVKPA